MDTKTPRTLHARKLLVAAVGIATVNYVAVACESPTSGNLPAGRGSTLDSGPAPPPVPPPTSGNLPMPRVDARPDCVDEVVDAGDGGDAGDADADAATPTGGCVR